MSAENFSKTLTPVDKMILALEYKPEEILTFAGEKSGNVTPAEGSLNGGTYTITKREKRNTARTAETFSIMDAIKDSTFPGSLLLAIPL